MSALYGTINGDASKTEASRRGHRHISGHVRGWNCGVEVRGAIGTDGTERFEVYLTSGSSGAGSNVYLGRAYIGAGGPTFHYLPEEAPYLCGLEVPAGSRCRRARGAGGLEVPAGSRCRRTGSRCRPAAGLEVPAAVGRRSALEGEECRRPALEGEECRTLAGSIVEGARVGARAHYPDRTSPGT